MASGTADLQRDLGGAVKGFKDGMKGATDEKPADAPKAVRLPKEPRGAYAQIVLGVIDEAMGVDGLAHRRDVIRIAINKLIHDEGAGRDRRRDIVLREVNSLLKGGWLVVEGDYLRRAANG